MTTGEPVPSTSDCSAVAAASVLTGPADSSAADVEDVDFFFDDLKDLTFGNFIICKCCASSIWKSILLLQFFCAANKSAQSLIHRNWRLIKVTGSLCDSMEANVPLLVLLAMSWRSEQQWVVWCGCGLLC